MKKLILILFLIFVSYGCVRTSKAEGSVTETKSFQDTQKYVADLDTAQKDTIKRSKKSMNDVKLDTVSALPEIRRNMAIMKYQKKQLDSLLAKRRK
jgi:hypothetical protein